MYASTSTRCPATPVSATAYVRASPILAHPPDVLDGEAAASLAHEAHYVDPDLLEPDAVRGQPRDGQPAQSPLLPYPNGL